MSKFYTIGSVLKSKLRRRRDRKGSVLVFFALILGVLLALAGVVVDAGLLMASHRYAQNSADAAALAAAYDLLYGKSNDTAIASAFTFVKDHNKGAHATLHDAADPEVNIPPVNGPYAGMSRYAEVIVEYPTKSFFIHLVPFLPGIDDTHVVKARAVAGFEFVTAGAGVIVLDPSAAPGLDVGGGARLIVDGDVLVNSEGGGVTEDGVPLDGKHYGASVSNNSTLQANYVRVVGGVDNPENFQSYDPAATESPLHADMKTPVPDPFITIDTPWVANGVDPTEWGEVKASDGGSDPGDVDPSDPYRNRVVDDPDLGPETLLLHPGIYTSIDVTGGNVRFLPGIYVLKPDTNTQTSLKITGGNVVASGVMFYNTGDNYSPYTGGPDLNDRFNSSLPPAPDGAHFGAMTINAAMKFEPIDLDTFVDDYGPYVDEYDPAHVPAMDFEGMLFYQRRLNDAKVDFQGNAEEGNLAGTIYGKWSNFKIAGQGTYDAQFVVGSLSVSGNGDVTIQYAGDKEGKAPQVFLVE